MIAEALATLTTYELALILGAATFAAGGIAAVLVEVVVRLRREPTTDQLLIRAMLERENKR